MNEFQRAQLRNVAECGEFKLTNENGELYARTELRAAANYLQDNEYIYSTQTGELRPTEKGEQVVNHERERRTIQARITTRE